MNSLKYANFHEARIYLLHLHIITLKPSISSHSKPRIMARMRLLKCFVLQQSVIKTKHLRSLV